MTKEQTTDSKQSLFNENIVLTPVEKEIKESYISYAMSVIAQRALPDTRDGLKPVIRRILYAMYEMGIFHTTKHKKSARIVGEVLGKYHPHGDQSVYDAMVRLAQPWSMRYPLVDGQGNFGSMDGDGPAAMRYTEAKLTAIAEEMLEDLGQDTIDWRDNFDGSLKEPIVLSTKFPNHLCNGTMGIAVGMATNMAPHNLCEVIDACLLLLQKEGKVLAVENKSEKEESDKNLVILFGTTDVLFTKKIDEKGQEVFTIDPKYAFYLKTLVGKKFLLSTNTVSNQCKGLLATYDIEIIDVDTAKQKLNKDFFAKILSDNGFLGEYVVYVDVNTENIVNAKDAGITNVVEYHTPLQMYYELNDIQKRIQKNLSEVSIEEIMKIIKGPDFPTGGQIFDPDAILEVYKKGKGSIVVRGKVHFEDDKKHGKLLVIDEIPYQVNKATLCETIGNLVADKKIDGIEDVRDESSRDKQTGKDKIRIVITLRKGVNPDKILIQLYKMTELQTTFTINNVTLVEDGKQPRLLNIKDLLMEFIVFRRQVVYRRSVFLLSKARERLHILEGLKKAIDNIDAVITTIRHSQTKAEAKEKLMTQFGFTDPQAEHILMMRLQSLVGLEMQKVIDEITAKQEEIVYLENIINDPNKLDAVVADELIYIKDTYGDARRTEVVETSSNLKASFKDIMAQVDKEKQDCIVWIGNDLSVRMLYQSRIINIPSNTIDLIYTHNQDKLITITDLGELVVERLKDFGDCQMKDPAVDLKQKYNLTGNVVFVRPLHAPFDDLVLLTSGNNIKKIDKNLVLSFKKFPTKIITLADGEKIVAVLPVSSTDKVGIVTKKGWLLVFPVADFRNMGKTATGVKAIELQEGDQVASGFLYKDEPFIFIYDKKGGKMLSIEDLRIWKRAKKGQKVVNDDYNGEILGGIGIVEGAVSIVYEDSNQQTIHSNDIDLSIPQSGLYPLIAKTNLKKDTKPKKEENGQQIDDSENFAVSTGSDEQMIDYSKKIIKNVFRPWEEKEENVRYKEEKKKEEKMKKKEQTQNEVESQYSDTQE